MKTLPDQHSRSKYGVPLFVRYLLYAYVTALLMLSCGRFILYLFVHDGSYPLWDRLSLRSFLIGLQFDTVVLCYLLSLPLLLLFLQRLRGGSGRGVYWLISGYVALSASVLLLIVTADLPYFRFFHMRVSESALQWMNDWKTVLHMIADDSLYLGLLIGLLIIIPAMMIVIVRNSMRFLSRKVEQPTSSLHDTLFFLLLAGFCFLGMRGRIDHPIRMGDAVYCHSHLLNQMGLNPAFCLLKSYTERVSLMNDQQAISLTRSFLQVTNPDTSISPFARKIVPDLAAKKYNVVLVLMESMSARYMKYFGNEQGLTPNLDRLAGQSMFFRNAYSAGIHTNNGIFSSLYSFPALKAIRPMNTMPIRKYSGLPFVTRQYGYQNIFFCAHSFEFDNIVNFIPENSFDRIISSDMFPPEAALSGFGVPDGYLFNEVLHYLDSAHTTKPFFATILTASNHEPYALPASFEKKYAEAPLNTTAYADQCIGVFLEQARSRKWFDSTIFILVADHGFRTGKNYYELELSYQHIPIMFYAPQIIKPAVMDNLMGQIDIFPTLMGLMQMGYTNNTLGIDILTQPRDCIYFSADDKIGCIDNQWLYIYKFSGGESLYAYRHNDTHNFASEKKETLEKLRRYAFAHIQSAEWIYRHDRAKIAH